ncbi:hypothetical protein Bequi_13865 [Brachybacterium sp. JHP9]|uniref:DNA adenine methylase n=1 Tax=Brachybacterium equifaecis TaxID=2910770 RepID=A0ABT0R3G2_9MICO|nr:hypothetical protein [Brachybacterium equifaecis]MCL6424452.1 hypothetical protein [Brachybacterium equifaecis]
MTGSPAPRYLSPLRYPGGKARMAPWLAEAFWGSQGLLGLPVEVWLEPFGGGAGAALAALESHGLPEAWIVEANPALAAFWLEITGDDAERFARRVEETVPGLPAFWAARERVVDALVAGADGHDLFELGWAAFVLNRCSRSGMVIGNVGPIGGKAQSGRDIVSSRWNGSALAQRIRRIREHGSRFKVFAGDGISYLEDLPDSGFGEEVFVFADPPYIGVGDRLYAHGLDRAGHERLAAAIHGLPCAWALTYDVHPDVLSLYPEAEVWEFAAPQTTGRSRVGSEYLVLPLGMTREAGNPLGKGLMTLVQDGGSGERAHAA